MTPFAFSSKTRFLIKKVNSFRENDSKHSFILFQFFRILSYMAIKRGYLNDTFSIFWQDFLRQNNTGKLLWQVFGVQAASLCLFGITEHEEMMWNELNHAGIKLFTVFLCTF